MSGEILEGNWESKFAPDGVVSEGWGMEGVVLGGKLLTSSWGLGPYGAGSQVALS